MPVVDLLLLLVPVGCDVTAVLPEGATITSAPHSARRWFLVAQRMAMRMRTTRSVSARSAIGLADAVAGRVEDEKVRALQARKERVRLRMLVIMVVM